DTVRPIIEARKHELNVEMPKEMVYLHADPVRLSQILSNLLNNSAKYTDPGGRIDLTAEVQGRQLRITVSDNGMGIAPETMPTIFQMFTQGDSSLERRQGGLGVGLALTRGLVELHGGAIQVHSAGSGLGTSFAVSLPTVEAPRLVEEQEVQPAAEPKHALRILLVDDNVDFASSLALLLKEMGHQVSVAHEAQGGLEAARALRPEVAFLDIGLPGINGYELARQLRELAAAADTVLIALSGWGQQQDRMRSHQAGFARHMVKPVELKQILAVLDSLATEA
ncbi:MAG TPA: ATP-binding protein, partial [Gammaproteobacteria bacterium]|nr:ATP-binding protein [Gammaproteobacteria bacterium]